MTETLRGVVERVTYANPENGYSVVRLAVKGKLDLVTVVGSLADVNPGESLELEGTWSQHRQYGQQFKVHRYRTILPATADGIRRYLGSGMIKGIGPVMAERIVDRYGVDTLDVIEHDPGRLLDVLGIGRKRVERIRAAWAEQKQIREVMIFLQGHGVRSSWAVKVYKAFGDASIEVIQQDPYRLAREIQGIGFKTADQIARNLGLPSDSPRRVAAGVAYALSEMANEGHVYAPQEALVETAVAMLEVPAALVEQGVDDLEAEEEVQRETLRYALDGAAQDAAVREERAVYLRPFYYGEVGVARRLEAMLGATQSRLQAFRGVMWEVMIAPTDGVQLSERQREAVRTALTQLVAVLTGGPGTGKTTTVRTVIDLLERFRCRYALAAPTGRAAKRLAEASGRPAKTVHRLLGYKPGQGFAYDETNPLDVDMLIVDEASMLDLLLTNHLLKAIAPGTHLLLVGDVDQLPSVGAGNVLRDVIDSGRVPVVRLDLIFRQAQDSLIITNAHRINAGLMPLFHKSANDFFLFVQDDPDQAGELVVDIVRNRIPRKFGYDPVDDIQVLSPMYRGAVGVNHLNERLQAELNPPTPRKAERRLGGRVFRAGDRVIQLRNNYDLDVYNGDVGRVQAVDVVNQALRVRYDEHVVEYAWDEADELALAYAVSVHKSQGSEYRAVVIPVMTTHYMMLQRPVLYTAVTRAQELVVLVGSRRAIAIAVRNAKVTQRHSGLSVRIAS
ncbi:MAG: ATP-dependent RecD-like DNA helicase [Anaerolineae bacterium]|nr:ATP-dependent RecD-like DNA helicase [Anaerolineae bacterium]